VLLRTSNAWCDLSSAGAEQLAASPRDTTQHLASAPDRHAYSAAMEDSFVSRQHPAVSLPDFNPAWQKRFLLSTCPPGLYLFRSMVFMFSTFVLLGILRARQRETDALELGNDRWFVIVHCGYGACVLLSWVILIISSIPRLRPFAVRHRDILACVWIVVSFLGVSSTNALVDMRRAMFNLRLGESGHPGNESDAYQHLTYNISRSHFLSLPAIQCTDAEEALTLTTWTTAEEPGCALRIVYGPVQVLFISAFMCMSTLKMGPRAACWTVMMSVAGWSLMVVITGHAMHFNVWLTLLLMAIAGPADIVQCILKRRDEENEFAAKEGASFAAKQCHDLLRTLLPPNVLETVVKSQPDASPSSGHGQSLMCSEIPHGTVLFCAWKFTVESEQDFARIGSLVQALDRKVEESGFYKYQVGGSCALPCWVNSLGNLPPVLALRLTRLLSVRSTFRMEMITTTSWHARESPAPLTRPSRTWIIRTSLQSISSGWGGT